MARGDRGHKDEHLIVETVDRHEGKERGDVRRDAILSDWVEAQAVFADDRLCLRHLDKQHGVSGRHAARLRRLCREDRRGTEEVELERRLVTGRFRLLRGRVDHAEGLLRHSAGYAFKYTDGPHPLLGMSERDLKRVADVGQSDR